jgi:predicted amidohydrolase
LAFIKGRNILITSSSEINPVILSKKKSIAIIQQPPVYLNLAKSVDLAIEYVDECTKNGAEIIVFPETWLPGYPVWLDYSPNAGIWDHPPAKTIFRLLVQNSISINDEFFEHLLKAAQINDCLIVMGCHEKVGRTLYNTIFYFKADGSYDLHRKLMPTYTERLVWGQGDGSTLPVIGQNGVRIGGLICWEHWMPLGRAAMHQQNEDIHIAQWPMVKDLHQIASRNYAFEGQCFVLAAGCTLTKAGMLSGVESICNSEEDQQALVLIKDMPIEDDEFVLRGGSSVIKPNSEYLVEPILKRNELIYADLDLNQLSEGNLFLDTSGHYSRPDVFQLKVDTRVKQNVEFEN